MQMEEKPQRSSSLAEEGGAEPYGADGENYGRGGKINPQPRDLDPNVRYRRSNLPGKGAV